jgi:hypothetical protein
LHCMFSLQVSFLFFGIPLALTMDECGEKPYE